jgi:glycosyltransferase involved in cell wall biosynthesis
LIVGPERKAGANEEAEFVRGVRETLTSGRGRDRVTFVGRVQDVEEYMRAADVFVLPTHREGMPNVVLEAFASGLPSVLTPFRGLPEELGRPGQEYVLVEHDVSLLGQAIVDLLSDASRREQVGQAAFRWAREQLDLEKSLDRLAEILNDVARTSGRV